MAIKNGRIVSGVIEDQLKNLTDDELKKEIRRFQRAVNRAIDRCDESNEYHNGLFLHAHQYEEMRRVAELSQVTLTYDWEQVVEEIPGINS